MDTKKKKKNKKSCNKWVLTRLCGVHDEGLAPPAGCRWVRGEKANTGPFTALYPRALAGEEHTAAAGRWIWTCSCPCAALVEGDVQAPHCNRYAGTVCLKVPVEGGQAY
eukprot:NODE_2022_length_522_cov_3.235589_g2007_i0.p1 GENE.NODE_2022_length_522_cov_3.235589_g2007_i0~~NODE_2022_length_522_cov_3.235589_g2007_i0.p1  ORF type:complete len:109 (-),score=11.22 NODE_2022_length_522_cov_3.235589_g2007_i0:96-422(-)